jgi:hypothetical protein
MVAFFFSTMIPRLFRNLQAIVPDLKPGAFGDSGEL